MSGNAPELWIGMVLRGFGGDPPPHSGSLRKLFGLGFPSGCLRDDLFSWDMSYVRLTEGFSMPPEGEELSVSDPKGGLAELFPRILENATRKLHEIRPSLIEQWRSEGRDLDVFIIVQTSAEGIRVPLSTEFLTACNELKLAVEVYADHGGNFGQR
jgi:hypothetical protein